MQSVEERLTKLEQVVVGNGTSEIRKRTGEEQSRSWIARLELKGRVQELEARLKALEADHDNTTKTRHLSNTGQISLVFSYQSIIGMGPAVVPLILAELEREPDHWFWALEAITGENPVNKDDAGDIEASANAWVEWGRQNGQLRK